jgi:hypothetical protein
VSCVSSNSDQLRIKISAFWDMMLFSLLGKYQFSEKTTDSIFREEELSSSKLFTKIFVTYNRNIYCIIFLSLKFTKFEIIIYSFK